AGPSLSSAQACSETERSEGSRAHIPRTRPGGISDQDDYFHSEEVGRRRRNPYRLRGRNPDLTTEDTEVTHRTSDRQFSTADSTNRIENWQLARANGPASVILCVLCGLELNLATTTIWRW